MQFSSITIASVVASIAAAGPINPFPLANGFPNPLNTSALQQVFKLAGGTIPNGPSPTNISAAGIKTLQLIAANELFEVAYFTQLLANITNNVTQYSDGDKTFIKDSLTAIINVSLMKC